jgi:predicted nucleotidyltransferase
MMNETIKSLCQAAGQAAKAECVYVFGSQARGDTTKASDVDMALIIPDEMSPRAALRAALRATAQRMLPIDLVIITHSTWTGGLSLLARQVKKEGILLYGK